MKIVSRNSKDGIILLATELSRADYVPFFKSGHPLVVLDSSLVDSQCDTVLINNFQGAYDAVAELIRQGHQQIGYLRSQVPIYNFSQRHLGVISALADAQLTLQPEYVCSVEPSIEGSYRGVSDWLDDQPAMPTAFFADNDIIAFGAMKALKEHNLKIPEDISIIGFDDLPYCDIIDPPLTTIKVYKHSLGKLAVDRLISRMHGEVAEVVRIEVATELVSRNSIKFINR